MHKMTQAEFDALKRNEDGFLVIPDNTDCTAIEFNTADRVIFGNCCKLGDYSILGDECEFGNWCKLGNDCELGEWCKLGDCINARATFEGGRVQDGLQMKISNTLNRYQTVYFYIDKYEVIFIQVGNWFGYLNDFKAYIEDINSNATYEELYSAMCDYAKAVLPQMLKKSDAKRKGATA